MPINISDKDLTLHTPWGYFNHRVGCLILRNNSILLQWSDGGYWFVPGGRVAFGESSPETVFREMQEEFGCLPEHAELTAIIENFFVMEGTPFHEVAFLYRLNMQEGFSGDAVNSDGSPAVTQWHALDNLDSLDIKPKAIKSCLQNISHGFQHIVNRD